MEREIPFLLSSKWSPAKQFSIYTIISTRMIPKNPVPKSILSNNQSNNYDSVEKATVFG